jgi:micrococcal nuclease
VLPTATAASNEQTGIVTQVIDGDTVDVLIGDSFFRVRYIGINTPESNEPCGSEATAANSALVAGRTVTLVKDVSETDQYGRLLRYVYVGNVFVNAELVRTGWAEAVAYPPDTAQAGYLESLEAGAPVPLCAAPQPTTAPQPTAVPQPTAPAANCDPSYPTVCIPPYPPDIDCGDIPHRRFQVIPPDPHGFDGDNDGIGCESG